MAEPPTVRSVNQDNALVGAKLMYYAYRLDNGAEWYGSPKGMFGQALSAHCVVKGMKSDSWPRDNTNMAACRSVGGTMIYPLEVAPFKDYDTVRLGN